MQLDKVPVLQGILKIVLESGLERKKIVYDLGDGLER